MIEIVNRYSGRLNSISHLYKHLGIYYICMPMKMTMWLSMGFKLATFKVETQQPNPLSHTQLRIWCMKYQGIFLQGETWPSCVTVYFLVIWSHTAGTAFLSLTRHAATAHTGSIDAGVRWREAGRPGRGSVCSQTYIKVRERKESSLRRRLTGVCVSLREGASRRFREVAKAVGRRGNQHFLAGVCYLHIPGNTFKGMVYSATIATLHYYQTVYHI